MSELARRLRRMVAAAAAAALICLLPAVVVSGTAYASDSLTVTKVTLRALTAVASVSEPLNDRLPATGVSASLNGRTVPVSVVSQSSRSTAPALRRSVVLLLDTSGSMRGAPLAAAMTAARRFVADLPSDVSVGIVTFEHQVHVLVRPTADHANAAAALDQLKAGGDTSLYDGVLAATRLLGNSGDRRIVLLSDGGDSASTATLASAARAVGGKGPSLTAIALGRTGAARHALSVLATAGNGHVVTAADTPALAGAFRVAAGQYSARLTLSVPVPTALAAGPAQLSVSVPTAGGRRVVLHATATLAAPRNRAAATGTSRTGEHWLLALGLGGVGAGLVVLVAVAWGLREQSHGREARTRRLLGQYTLAGRSAPVDEPPTVLGTTRFTRTAVEFAGRLLRRRDYEARLAMRLDRAGVSLRPAEWVLVQGGLVAASLLVTMLLSRNALVAGGVALLLGVVAPQLVLSIRIGRRRNAFLLQLPDTLTVVAGSLRAGYSLAQALDTVVREGAQPFAGEISRALAASRIGIPLEDALDEVAERMAVRDFAWVVMAVRTQREVGGNLSEILRTVAATMRERAQLRRHVRALSAEGRLSAYILIGLPILMAAYEFCFRRDYIESLYTTGLGIAMLGAATLLVVIGSIWMAKLVKVEV